MPGCVFRNQKALAPPTEERPGQSRHMQSPNRRSAHPDGEESTDGQPIEIAPSVERNKIPRDAVKHENASPQQWGHRTGRDDQNYLATAGEFPNDSRPKHVKVLFDCQRPEHWIP